MIGYLFTLAAVLAVITVTAAASDAWLRHQSKARRDGWRAHRDYMDSLEPKRWTT